MALDVEKYLPYLDGYGWSREEKIEILRCVWRMMEARADQAFELNALPSTCGQSHQNSLRNQRNSLDSEYQSLLSQSYGEATNDHSHDAMSSKGNKKYAK